MKIYIYILGASCNPDKIECNVPFQVDEKEIFFGPCAKYLRKKLKKEYLKAKSVENVGAQNLYVVGLNGLNVRRCPKRERKIVWIGKILKLMTFEYAYEVMRADPRYEMILNAEESPLHVKPISNSAFKGYELRWLGAKKKRLHEAKSNWVWDLIDKRDGRKTSNKFDIRNCEKVILKNPKDRGDVFTLDCCFILENLHFADGKRMGIRISDAIEKIFKEVKINIRKGFRNYKLIEGEYARKIIDV